MIYIHIPFCHRKCTYCAFYSQPIVLTHSAALTHSSVSRADSWLHKVADHSSPNLGEQPEVQPASNYAYDRGSHSSPKLGEVPEGRRSVSRYVDALCRELAMRRHSMEGPVRTVYFGGGTPSLLPIDLFARIAEALRANYDLSALEECTLEANPEDLTPQYLADLRALGLVDRLSLGIQSLQDSELRLIGRRHTAAQAVEAVHAAAAAGFDNITIDLIYGIPGQTEESWRDTLRQAAALPVTHLSAYALTVEPGTILEKQIVQGRVPSVNDEAAVAHYRILLEWAAAQCFEQYEVSNFARPGHRSRHNSRYWNRTPYLGVGAAAHSFDGEYRRWNVSDVQQYCSLLDTGRVPHEEEQLTLRDAHNEYLMTALRTVEGIDKALVPRPFARALATKIQKYVDSGLLADTPTHYRPTPDGLLHADGIAADLFE